MTRSARWLGLLLLAVGLVWPAPAHAIIFGPFNQIGAPSQTSTQVSNTVTQTNIASYSIPAGFLGSGRAHLKILGNLSTAQTSPGTFTITVTVCGQSITAVNAATLDSALANAPASFDVWLSPYASSQRLYVFTDWRDAATSTTETVIKSITRATCDTTQPESITVAWTFGTASVANGFIAESPVFSMGQ